MNKKELEKINKEHYIELIQLEKKDQEIKNKCLMFVKENTSSSMYNDILEYINDDSDYTGQFSLTNKVPDEKYKQVDDCLSFNAFVYQNINGGYFGDHYSGWIFIKITNDTFLKFNYSTY